MYGKRNVVDVVDDDDELDEYKCVCDEVRLLDKESMHLLLLLMMLLMIA